MTRFLLLLTCVVVAHGARAAHGPDPVSRKVATDLLASAPAPRSRAVGRVHAVEPWRDGARAHVYVRVTSTAASTIDALRVWGLEITAISPAFGGLVDGWTNVSALPALAALPTVTMIRPVAPPITQAGAVVSEGDGALGADRVRTAGIDGSGVTLGLISDGITSLGTSMAAGELPDVTVPPDPRCNNFNGDEGTAMLEIVHDVAPGARLLFGSFGQSGAQMAETVRCLADAGAQVIVDDVTFPDEPFFQDGPLATAAREVVQRGVSYHTSAGNRRREFLEQTLRPAAFGPPLGVIHDFTGNGDPANEVTVAAGRGATCVLQWDEPFGAAATDLDLLVVQGGAQNVIAQSSNPQDGTQDPIEMVNIGNPTDTDQVVSLVVVYFGGSPQRRIRVMCLRSIAMEQVSIEGAIYGQQSVSEVVTVASIDVADSGLDTIEADSSPGPATILFPAPETREKPDLASFDGVTTSVRGFERFFGTSAAAPHAGAVAALMLSKNPALSPAQVQQIMKQTAIDIEGPGFDRLAGAGRLDALAALGGVPCLDASALPGSAECPGERVPHATQAAYKLARGRLVRAAGAPGAKVRRLLRSMPGRLVRGLRAAERRAAKGKLGATCNATLRTLLGRAGIAATCRLSG